MLVEELRRAGVAIVVRDQRPVAANFGSTGAEVAVCLTRVGVAERADLDALELCGGADWLAAALERVAGGPAPEPGRAVRVGGAWLAAVDLERALLVGRPGQVRRVAARAPSHTRRSERSGALAALTLVGPRLRALLAAAGLPCELEPGEVRACWFAGGRADLLCERPDRQLLLVGSATLAGAWAELTAAGRPLDVACVGVEALDRLAAAGL
jgi:hypothetical protein